MEQLTKTQQEGLEALDGQEIWTNNFADKFGERVCIGVEGRFYWHEGKKYKLPTRMIKVLLNDLTTQEFGSNKQMMRDLEKEFGGGK